MSRINLAIDKPEQKEGEPTGGAQRTGLSAKYLHTDVNVFPCRSVSWRRRFRVKTFRLKLEGSSSCHIWPHFILWVLTSVHSYCKLCVLSGYLCACLSLSSVCPSVWMVRRLVAVSFWVQPACSWVHIEVNGQSQPSGGFALCETFGISPGQCDKHGQRQFANDPMCLSNTQRIRAMPLHLRWVICDTKEWILNPLINCWH